MTINNFNIPPEPSVAPKKPESEPVPHSGIAGIEHPVVPDVEDISEKVVANTEIPGTVTEGFGAEDSVQSGERADWDQLKKEQAKTNADILQNRPPSPTHAGFSHQDEKQADGNAFVNFLKKPAGKITAGLAGLALVGSAVGLGIGIGAKDGNKTETTPPDPSKTVASAPATAGAIETAPAVIYQPEVDPANCPTVDNAPDSQAEVAPVSVVECGNFKDLSPEQKQFVLKNEQMSVADFYKQPMQDQLKFANFVVENRANVGQAILNKNLTQLGLAQYGLVPNYEHTQNYQEVDNTVVGQMDATFQAIVYGSVTTDASGTITLDKVTAKKMLVAFAVPGSEVFNALTSAIDSPRSVNNIFEINTGTGVGTLMFINLGTNPTNAPSISVGDIQDVKTYTANIQQGAGTPVGVTGVAPTQFSSGLGYHDTIVSLVHSTNLDGTPKTNALVSKMGPVRTN
jgi:hypothetical protein